MSVEVEGSTMSYEVINNSKNLIHPEEDLTPIQQFYSGANVFVTGGTGFLGRILIEKLLRSCPTIGGIYILVRNKKGKNLHTRIDELFDDVIFERLKQECPKFRHKVIAIAGDCSLPDLGLSLQDRKILIDEISVIFHVAATVRFDEKLKLATAINVRSPLDIINISRQMSNLKAFIHVSTAYSNCPNSVIEERFYPSPIDSKKLLTLTESLPDKIIENITPSLLGAWPNTYAYTKGIAEDVVKQNGQDLPLGVFRPAIVISTYQEPTKGWINNLYGPTGVCAGAGTGVIRTLHCNSKINANVVPVDMCVNSLIATAWEVANDYQISLKEKKSWDIPIYNYESSNDQPITWGTFMHYSESYGINYPSVKALWYYFLTLQSTRVGYFILSMLLHYFPALIVDLVLLCIGKTPNMMKIYKKIHKFTDVISYFCTRNWIFVSKRVQNTISKMSEKDKRIFFCDLKQLDWEEFFTCYLRGIRVYLLQDPMNTLPEAKVKWNRLYCIHQVVRVLVLFLLARLAWTLGNLIYSSV